jgi:hypothetical protein
MGRMVVWEGWSCRKVVMWKRCLYARRAVVDGELLEMSSYNRQKAAGYGELYMTNAEGHRKRSRKPRGKWLKSSSS